MPPYTRAVPLHRTPAGARGARSTAAGRRGSPARRVWRFGRERLVYDGRSPDVLIYRERGLLLSRERPLPVDLTQVELRHATLEVTAPGFLLATTVGDRDLARVHQLIELVGSRRRGALERASPAGTPKVPPRRAGGRLAAAPGMSRHTTVRRP